MEQQPKFRVKFDAKGAVPGLNAEFGRVNVILGANGTGKSKIIGALIQQAALFGSGRPVVYVEGGRVVNPADTVQDINSQRVTEKQLLEAHKKRCRGKLQTRVSSAFQVLGRVGRLRKDEHYEELLKWVSSGCVGPPPEQGKPQLNNLFTLFTTIFPQIAITVDTARKIVCSKGGSVYKPSELSDGEKQVLCLLADIVFLADANSVVLIDEPELNLNPRLACSVWDTIESSRPNALFIYASHCLSFALRSSVDTVVVLGEQRTSPVVISDVRDIDSGVLAEFLGAVPGILVADRAVAIEGNEDSFDNGFYNWLVDDKTVAVAPMGDCEQVRAAATQQRLWDRLATRTNIIGIVDRDFRSDAELNQLAKDSCIVLDYHEAESYLCHPKVVAHTASALGLTEPVPTEETVTQELVRYCDGEIFKVALKRTLRLVPPGCGPLLSNQVMGLITTEAAAESALLRAVEDAQRNGWSGESCRMAFAKEFIACKSAVEKCDVDELLKLFPGKQLLARMAHMAGCSNPIQMLNAVKKHWSPAVEYSKLTALRSQLSGNRKLDINPAI
jgi:energy-coupling factor transporter ATP-binding protein EcfA2